MPCNRLLLSIYNNTHNNMITFHNNLTKAKIANELIMSVQSLNILHLNYSTKSCLISWPVRLVKPWMLQTFQVRFPVLINHPK